MGDLPFERIDRTPLIRQQATTTEKFGCDPQKRSVKELLDYGIVNLDKPSGPTSHQVSAYVKGVLHLNKTGHSGTLDPGVTGILPVALGRGTRVVQSLLTAGKEYVCLMQLHEERSTKEVEAALKKFTGKITQMPPVKSAVKRQWRKRNVYYNELLDHKGTEVLFRTGCQAGTYIRKLCLHPSTEILTENDVLSAEEFVKAPQRILTKKGSSVSFQSPSATQILSSPQKLLQIKTSSGVTFTVTKDHEMLMSTPEGYEMIEARRLKKGFLLVKHENYLVPTKKFCVPDLLDDGYLLPELLIKECCKEAMIKRFGSIRAMNREIGLDRKVFLSNSPSAISIGHLKQSGIYEQIKHQITQFKSEKGTLVSCPRLSKDHFYLLGLIASDGNNTKEKGTIRRTRIKFHNKNKDLIDTFQKIYSQLFPDHNFTIKKLSSGIYQFDSANSFFATIAASLGIKSPQKQTDLKPLLFAEKNLLRSFLKGYFDGDGTVYFKKKKRIAGYHHNISYFTVSEINAKRLHQMLLKIGIPNKIFKKTAIFVISVESPAAKRAFIKQVGSSHPEKNERFKKLIEILPDEQIDDHELIGLHYKEELRIKRAKLSFLGGNLSRILKNHSPITKRLYRRAQEKVTFPSLDSFVVEEIKSIKTVSGSHYVYDMTVPKTHNFLIETGYVSSNCHDMGTFLGCGAHMAELRRSKAGPFQENETMVTLHDLADAYAFWKEDGDETQIRKCVQPLERAVDHLPKIVITDTTVDSICHGATLKVPGVVSVESNIQVGEPVAVMTLKGELVCVGDAIMISKDIANKARGIAVKSSQVFMLPGTYPKA